MEESVMITIEQIDEFRKRTHSSYEDAKYFLERNNGDVLDAIIDFERSKTGRGSCYNRQSFRGRREDYGMRLGDVIQKGFDTRIYVEDKNSTLFSIPVIVLLLLIPLWIIVLALFIFFIMLGYKVSIRDVKNSNVNVNDMFKNMSYKMKDQNPGGSQDAYQRRPDPQKRPEQYPVPTGSNMPVSQNNNNQPVPQNGEPKKEDGYKEYTIE
jgi:hypothetical protein